MSRNDCSVLLSFSNMAPTWKACEMGVHHTTRARSGSGSEAEDGPKSKMRSISSSSRWARELVVMRHMPERERSRVRAGSLRPSLVRTLACTSTLNRGWRRRSSVMVLLVRTSVRRCTARRHRPTGRLVRIRSRAGATPAARQPFAPLGLPVAAPTPDGASRSRAGSE